MFQKQMLASCQLNSINKQTFDSDSFFDQDHDSNQFAPIQGQLSPQRYKNPEDEVLSDSNSNQDHQRAFNGFEEDPFIEEPRRKVVKQTTEYSKGVPVTNPTNAEKGKKYSGLTSNNILQAQDAAKKETLFDELLSEEEDSLLSYLIYKPIFECKKGYLKMQLDVSNIPVSLDKIPWDEVKNYHKNLGDYFIDYLVDNQVIKKHQLKKDCLSSKAIWNTLFDLDKRKKFKSNSKEITNFLFELTKLSEQVTQQDWISYFLEFASTFDLEVYRTSTDNHIQTVERKQLYKLLTKNLKEAVTILDEKLQSVGIQNKITDFEVGKLYKTNVVFLLKFDSSIEVKPLIKQLNKCDVGVSVVNHWATRATTEKKPEMMEEEKDYTHILSSALEIITQPSNEGVEENGVFPAHEQQQQESEEEAGDSLPALPFLDKLAVSWEEWLQNHPSQPKNDWEGFVSYHNENIPHYNRNHCMSDDF